MIKIEKLSKMKKSLSLIGVIIMTTLINVGCGKSADDINVPNLGSPCEYYDAMNEVLEVVIELNNTERKNWDDLDFNVQRKYERLMDKSEDIDETFVYMEFEEDDFEGCDIDSKEVSLKKKLNKCPMFYIMRVPKPTGGIIEKIF